MTSKTFSLLALLALAAAPRMGAQSAWNMAVPLPTPIEEIVDHQESRASGLPPHHDHD